MPTFERRTYDQSDFIKLLNNDEPYIPSVRYRKRKPSSTLSIKEREQGLTESDLQSSASNPTTTKTQPAQHQKTRRQKPKQQQKTTQDAIMPKPKKRKKPNAKPRAKHDDW